MTTATEPETREKILKEIDTLETRLAELRSRIPTAIKSFYRFRCRPPKFVWVYASSRDEAEAKLHDRMNCDYPPDSAGNPTWSVASGVVDIFHEPQVAAANSPGNLLSCLTAADAAEFIADFRENERGREVDPEKTNLPKSQLEQDIESYEYRLARTQAGFNPAKR